MNRWLNDWRFGVGGFSVVKIIVSDMESGGGGIEWPLQTRYLGWPCDKIYIDILLIQW